MTQLYLILVFATFSFFNSFKAETNEKVISLGADTTEINIESPVWNFLYKNCRNELVIKSSDPETEFSTNNGTIEESDRAGCYFLVPDGATPVVISAKTAEGTTKRKYMVRPVPTAEITLMTSGKEVNLKFGEEISTLKELTVKSEPSDKYFISQFPKESRYRVAEWEMTLWRGSKQLFTRKFQKPTINMVNYTGEAIKGDRFIIEIKKVMRMNYKDEVLYDVAVLPYTESISLLLN